MNIKIPEDTEKMIEAVLASDGSIAIAPAYMRALAREDQLTRTNLRSLLESSAEKLEELAVEGLESGQPIDTYSKFWEERRKWIRCEHNNSQNPIGCSNGYRPSR